ncbi:UNVERIFIED_CONTAM: hypothetical protein FKN15_053704 [Acipenser sinensis]
MSLWRGGGACSCGTLPQKAVRSHSLIFFINRFACLLPDGVTVDQLEDEFHLYQRNDFEDHILTMRIDKD